MIIDIRCRLTTRSASDYVRNRLGAQALSATLRSGTEEAFFRELEQARVTAAASPSGVNSGMTLGKRIIPPRSASNDEQASIQKRYPGRFIGVAGIDVANTVHNGLEELERCVCLLGLRVASIEPGRAPMHAANPSDSRIYPFYSLAQDLDIPVVIQTSGLWGGKNIDYGHPRWIDQVAEDFPDLNIICGHGCFPFVREMITVVRRRENVFTSPDMYIYNLGRDEWLRTVNSGAIADQFLFGSAYPFMGPLRRSVDRFMFLPWRPAVLDRILYRNALRAFKLDRDPIFAAACQQSDNYTWSRLLMIRISALAFRGISKMKAVRGARRD